jgi:outer membrane lipoprotein
MKKILLVTSLLLISACSSIPEKLQLSEGTSLTNYTTVRALPAAHLGEKVRWGGVIAKVENKSEQTMVEVVHLDLDRSARPKVSNDTPGRFRVYFPGLLDPVIYKQGKSITFTGQLSSVEAGTIGEQAYQFPVVKGDAVYLWKHKQQLDVRLVNDPFWSLYPHRRAYSARHYIAPRVIRKPRRSPNNKKMSSQVVNKNSTRAEY